MDNMFSLPLAIRTRNSGGISTQESAVESNSFNFSYQNHQVVDVVHGNPVNDEARRIFETINFGGSSVGLGFQEQFMVGRGCCPQENMGSLGDPNNTIDLRGGYSSYIDDPSDNIQNPFMIPSDGGFGAGLESKWDFEEKTGGFSSVGYMVEDARGWSGGNLGPEYPPYTCPRTSNELSLSLGVPDQSSEVGTSGAAVGATFNSTNGGLTSEQASSGCNHQLSRSFTSQPPFRGSGSRYLHAVQEILAQIASFSLERIDQTSYSAPRSRGNMSFYSHQIAEIQDGAAADDDDDDFQPQVEPAVRKRTAEAKNAQLLALLQAVDDRYNQCVDEIHTVVSAFHAATELDPQVHTRFALQTISVLYRNLRETISKHIISTGAIIEKCGKEGGCSRNLFSKEQWSVKQVKNKQHQQQWKPQRGLPEKSVCVLRQWMFENFLHPYPKDAEKHVLAVKTGLTRGQVTNWFINARVRLWKPLIEEMYREMNNNISRKNMSRMIRSDDDDDDDAMDTTMMNGRRSKSKQQMYLTRPPTTFQ